MIKYKLNEEQLSTLYHYDKQNRFGDVKDFIRHYNANEIYASLNIISNIFENYSGGLLWEYDVIVSFKQLCKRDILDKESWKSAKPRGVVVKIGNRRFMYFIDEHAIVFDQLGILEVIETTIYTKEKKRYYKLGTQF